MPRFASLLAATVAACLLTGCGGGSGVLPSAPLAHTLSPQVGARLSVDRRRSDTYAQVAAFEGGRDGNLPDGQPASDGHGGYFGVTQFGGTGCAYANSGCGTVYHVVPSGSGFIKQIVYRFLGGSDGNQPVGAVAVDAAGNVYGATMYGGSSVCHNAGAPGCGIIFRLSQSAGGYRETIIYRFTGNASGAQPVDGVTMDASGNVYASASAGSLTTGAVVVKVQPTGAGGYKEQTIYTFPAITTSWKQGLEPRRLVIATNGTIYGVADGGGNAAEATAAFRITPKMTISSGCGTAFSLTPTSSGTYVHRTMYTFAATSSRDACGPLQLVYGSGILYGIAEHGGAYGNGAIFSLSPTGTERVVHSFSTAGGGFWPDSLTADGIGHLYGTASGGVYNGCDNGCGVAWEFTPSLGSASTAFAVLYRFAGGTQSWSPAGLSVDGTSLIGAAMGGGGGPCPNGCGTIFRLAHP